MERQRVLLICSQSLLGESLERILSQDENVELIGPWQPNDQVPAQIFEVKPDVALVAQEDDAVQTISSLTAQILEQHPDIPVICVGLAHNVVRIYRSSALPARSRDLLDAIRRLTRRSLDQANPA